MTEVSTRVPAGESGGAQSIRPILGISAFYHDSAAAIVHDGRIAAAAQEERFTRRKYDKRFPSNAIRFCLADANVRLSDLECVVFYEKPRWKVKRILENFLAFAPQGEDQFLAAGPELLAGGIRPEAGLRDGLEQLAPGWDGTLLFAEHHQSHAASAFFASPLKDATVLVADAVGEYASTSIHEGHDHALRPVKEHRFPHSLGMLYSAFTRYLGFRVNSGEYKLMGLAPYGEPTYANRILENLLDLKTDGSFRLNLEYFDFCTGTQMTSPLFDELFEGPARPLGAHPVPRDMDLAASIQSVTEEVLLRIVRSGVEETGVRSLCMAGGVALNCVANSRIARAGIVDRIWIQPAAGDAGGAVGAALAAYHGMFDRPRTDPSTDLMEGAFLGPDCAVDAEELLLQSGATFETLTTESLIDKVSDDLVEGRVVGWCQGRMEFGPRALGNRSILGDPRDPQMQSTMNLKIKFRESFRPFAPAILEDRLAEYFELDEPSPYMLLVADVLKERRKEENGNNAVGLQKLAQVRSDIPSVTHVDYSARVQTVSERTNPLFYELISAFDRKTGCPVVINTSFNVRGEPIVCDARDAFRCFMGTNMDVLVVGSHYLRKELQDPKLGEDYKSMYEPD